MTGLGLLITYYFFGNERKPPPNDRRNPTTVVAGELMGNRSEHGPIDTDSGKRRGLLLTELDRKGRALPDGRVGVIKGGEGKSPAQKRARKTSF